MQRIAIRRRKKKRNRKVAFRSVILQINFANDDENYRITYIIHALGVAEQEEKTRYPTYTVSSKIFHVPHDDEDEDEKCKNEKEDEKEGKNASWPN